jgi:hypothetical protein
MPAIERTFSGSVDAGGGVITGGSAAGRVSTTGAGAGTGDGVVGV